VPRGLDTREATALAVTAAYNMAVNRVLPRASHLPANLTASALLLLLLLLLAYDGDGDGARELGLAPDRAGPDVRTGLAVGAIAAAGVAAVAAIRPTRRLFVNGRVRDHSTAELVYHTFLRIPLATALGEELVFRAALLSLFSRRRSQASAGAGFAALRLRTGSVLAPAIVHAAIDGTALLAVRLVSGPSAAALA